MFPMKNLARKGLILMSSVVAREDVVMTTSGAADDENLAWWWQLWGVCTKMLLTRWDRQ